MAIFDHARRLVSIYRLRRLAKVGHDVVVRGSLWIRGGGRLEISDRVVLDAATAPIELHVSAGAVISIGDDVYIGGGTSIEAQEAVTIGACCRVGRFSKIIDNHFHSAAGNRNERPPSAPVVIEEDVDLGPRSILLPGAHVGHGTRIVARSVLTRRVPPGSLVSGFPAVVCPLPEHERKDRTGGAARERDGTVTRLGGLAHDARLVFDRMRSSREHPWTSQVIARLRALALFRECMTGEHLYAYGSVHVVAKGKVTLGSRVFFLGGMIPAEIKCLRGGELSIGAESGINYGGSIEAHQRVSIGRRCMIASMVTICDETAEGTAPIVIGDDVWVAHGAIIQPGAIVGNGAVVSAGSVVSGEVPPKFLALGNPARFLNLDLVRRRRSR